MAEAATVVLGAANAPGAPAAAGNSRLNVAAIHIIILSL
jgi:hypothetical protein